VWGWPCNKPGADPDLAGDRDEAELGFDAISGSMDELRLGAPGVVSDPGALDANPAFWKICMLFNLWHSLQKLYLLMNLAPQSVSYEQRASQELNMNSLTKLKLTLVLCV
jgi:hypothetical protein